MAQSPPLNSGRRDEPAEFNLREWALKARMISRENRKSRRFSSSYITSFREDDSKSFRYISSTASSPGYNSRGEEIDPSTYSFSSALRALQARPVNTWEGLSPEGYALHSKWDEAEKYICNPVSGEVPMECLSAKTLGGRSFRNLTSRITMSAPLIYPSHSRFIQATPTYNDEAQFQNIIKAEKKVANMLTRRERDVGVGSKLADLTSTPASSHQLGENSPMSNAATAAAANSTSKLKSEDKGAMKETDDGREETEREEEEETRKTEAGEKRVHHHNNMWKCRGGKIGCLSLRGLWMTRSDKHKSRNKMRKKKKNILHLPCYNNNNSRC